MAFLEDRKCGGHTPGAQTRVELVKDAFATMAELDLDGYLMFFSDDVEHVLAPVPKIKGKENLRPALARGFQACVSGLTVSPLSVVEQGNEVISDRVDIAKLGPLWVRFRIKATMKFVDDKVVFWQDSIDYLSLIGWSLRGLVGILIPRLRPQPPAVG
ncbi:limonene-1,2-epoxide hydrolase family protein [Mycobacterium sp. D16R24]|uniref:limonene-1,2-epoxide hydrolase family protein n=1 Tax=Mycobacterium sp. D16R24 TaxID=1855656 RepID=UPI0009921686|nr:limonene-1,2-epoxide hydrolase family protein [Mycobacterium sp. D16R24]